MKKQNKILVAKTAVIKGDIVASRKIAPTIREQLYKALEHYLHTLSKEHLLSRYESYRGDSIQCLATDAASALRVALIIRAWMMLYDTPSAARKQPASAKGYRRGDFFIRLAIGIGTIDFLHPDSLSLSDGEAFRLSGETLDNLKKDNQLLACSIADEAINRDIEPLVLLIDAITQKWTLNQAELALHKLLGKRDDEIAKELHISIPAVNQRKKTAQWSAIEKAVLYFENKLS